MTTTYEEFLKIVKQVHILGYTQDLLSWDEQVMMSKGGAKKRAMQTALNSMLRHEMYTSKRLGALLEQLTQENLSQDERVNVNFVAWEYERQKRVPAKLVEELSHTRSEAFHIWEEARAKKDFSLFAPTLKRLVELCKQVGEALDPNKPAYENLVNEYEPYMSIEEIRATLTQIKERLAPIVRSVAAAPQPEASFLEIPIDNNTQMKFNKMVAQEIGFDFTNGRLDLSTHPFTCNPADVRITTRFNEGWLSAIKSTVHEAGHGMYEQGLPDEHYATPRGMDAHLSIHESQSRIWENNIGMAKPFWKHFYPKMQARYSPLKDVDLDTFLHAANKSAPGFIRVNADELTYPMHIVLRFEIEEALISGTIEVEDVPRVWNEKMRDLLGITPPDAAMGPLQDVHWSSALFGYFPTYLLGTMIATQLYEAALKEYPDMEEQFAQGNFSQMLDWLRENIHQHGRRFTTQELIKQATGNEPRPDEYLAYLEKKYKGLYNLE